jgi:2EXR family
MELPRELRSHIWGLSIEPRLVPYNTISARGSRLHFDAPIHPLLQVCQESRAEVLKTHHLTNQTPYLAISPQDTVLWIRYNGPRTFDVDARRLEHNGTIGYIHHLALSIKFWNRITTNQTYSGLYRRIRKCKSLKILTIVDDNYGSIKWREMKGMIVRFEDDGWPLSAQEYRTYDTSDGRIIGGWCNKTKQALWKGWDAGVEFPKRELPEVRFARVSFSLPEK